MKRALSPTTPPELEPVPTFAWPLLDAHRVRVDEMFDEFGYELVTRGFEIRNWTDWIAVLKYRFVDPRKRMGVHANYIDRLRRADATITSDLIAIYRSPAQPPEACTPVEFTFPPMI